MARLLQTYNEEIRAELKDELGIGNPMAIPKLQKVVVSMGTGAPTVDKQKLPNAIGDMTIITGQKPQVRRARISVANFKLRADMEIGCRVTLRGKRMYEFVDRLFNAAIPRLRDFRGLNPKSFDGQGNYSMGLPDRSVFPEIDPNKAVGVQGLNLTFVTSAKTDAAAKMLLTKLGMPFRKTKELN